MTDAWVTEPPLVDERTFSPNARPGWHAWEGTNGMPAEVEFCEFAASLVRLVQPKLMIETGVGQGFTTRRLADASNGVVVTYEADLDYHESLAELGFWNDRVRLASGPTPTADVMRRSELTILDSNPPYRFREIEQWIKYAPSRGLLLVHDTQIIPRGKAVRILQRAKVRGVWLRNPRGCFLGEK